MPARRTHKLQTITRKAVELAVATPQVITQRLTRMALAGAKPTARDRKEFYTMGAEKVAAFTQSWSAMTSQAFQAQQKIGLTLLTSLWLPTTVRKTADSAVRQANASALAIIEKGMAPIHRRAVANAKRLTRSKLKP